MSPIWPIRRKVIDDDGRIVDHAPTGSNQRKTKRNLGVHLSAGTSYPQIKAMSTRGTPHAHIYALQDVNIPGGAESHVMITADPARPVQVPNAHSGASAENAA